ncbi:MAG: hypothetical protein LW636_12000 [Planctomycetaceae bacterium]|nr:hypothetical protein [Planctomycetaceae bacterium]
MRNACCLLASTLSAVSVAGAQTTVVTFTNGAEGWIGPTGPGGSTSIVATGGNPDANMRTVFNNFGISFFNSTNQAFLGDFTTAQSATIGIDVRVENLSFFGTPVSRPLLVELRDTTNPPAGYGWKSVWYVFAPLSSAAQSSWTSFSVTFDPNATALPPGWGGYGAENAVGEPQLPAGTTFRDVLKGVDAVVFTTLQPGFFYGFTDFTVRIDNLRVTRVQPNPADLDGSGTVNAADLSILLAAWGECPPKGACPADLNGDGLVDAADMSVLLAGWSA